MEQHSHRSQPGGWLDSSGLLYIFRTLRLACHPSKLAFAFAAIVLTFVLGTALDAVWKLGGGTVAPEAITRFIAVRELDQPYDEPKGAEGIFQVWREHQRRYVLGFLVSSIPGASVAEGTPLGAYVESHSLFRPLRYLGGIFYGTWWLVRHHTVFAMLFGVGGLIIWSLGGGAVCRIAAVEFARDERLSVVQAARFAWDKLWGGFFLAPCIPLGFAAFTLILLVAGGLVLRIPILGDLLGGLLFILAILGGFVVAILLIGSVCGGSLLWPVVAAEGSDAFDAFQRSLSYALPKAWKTIFYLAVSTIYASLCWVVVNLGTFFALRITRSAVAFGTSWWNRDSPEGPVTKLQLLWPMTGPNALHHWPIWSRLAWWEYFSAVCVWFWVLAVIALMWAFLVSFYFCASTIIYFLLRRDVDEIDLSEVYVEEPEADVWRDRGVMPVGSAAGRNISLPLADQGPGTT